MNLAIIVVTSNDEIHVRVLHTLLQLNSVINKSNMACNIHFCSNTAEEKATIFKQVTNGNYEKTLWLEIDIHIPVEQIVDVLNNHIHEDFVVFSSTESRVDWKQFTKFTQEETEDTEPVHTRGIISDLEYKFNPKQDYGKLVPITRCDLRAFIMHNKRVNKKLKQKFKNTKFFYKSKEQDGKFIPAHTNLCRLLYESGVRMKALADVNVTRFFKHEHVGCVMDTLGTHIREKQN